MGLDSRVRGNAMEDLLVVRHLSFRQRIIGKEWFLLINPVAVFGVLYQSVGVDLTRNKRRNEISYHRYDDQKEHERHKMRGEAVAAGPRPGKE